MTASISGWVVVAGPEDKRFWAGQPCELSAKFSEPKARVVLTAEPGAERHREPVAHRDERFCERLGEQPSPPE